MLYFDKFTILNGVFYRNFSSETHKIKPDYIGSLTSGLMGLGAGLVAVYAAYRSSSNPARWGLSLLVAISLTALMGFRFFNTGKVGIIPAIT